MTPDISDAAVEAFMHRRHELAGKPSTAEWLVRECMTAALPHLLPRELLTCAAETLSQWCDMHGSDTSHLTLDSRDLARRLRECAGSIDVKPGA